MELWNEKLIAACCIVFLTLVFGLLPVIFTKTSKSLEIRILSFCNAFAGGVFLSGGFVHLLSETGKMIEDSGLEIPSLPYPAFFCLIGFLIVFFIEYVMLSHSHIGNDEREEGGHSTINKTTKNDKTGKVDKNRSVPDPIRVIRVAKQTDTFTEIELSDFSLLSKETRELLESERQLRAHGQENMEEEKETSIVSIPKEGDDGDNHKELGLVSQIMGLVLVVVLSVHSLVAGFSMGMQTDTQMIVSMFVTIMSHKWVESFALGSNLLRAKFGARKMLLVILMYSLAVPIGILIGTAVQMFLTGKYAVIATIIATGIGSGTFIYVAIVDILVPEFAQGRDRYFKFVLVLFGLVLLSALLVFFDKN